MIPALRGDGMPLQKMCISATFSLEKCQLFVASSAADGEFFAYIVPGHCGPLH